MRTGDPVLLCVWSSLADGGAITVTVSVKLLYLIPAPKASWIPEAPRHFEESQWDPEMRASEEKEGECVCVCVYMMRVNGMKC